MILIADSGSTKTEWRLINSTGMVSSTRTLGLNPFAITKEAIVAELQNSELSQWLDEEIHEVHFYSAGIIDTTQKTLAAKTLNLFFSSSEIIVESDLLGAARAVFGNGPGIVGILGTGSNIGFYNGSEVTRRTPALGYLLGDEGSGAVLGKSLLKMFLRQELSDEIMTALKAFCPNYESLIETIYSEKHAAQFLASFVPFIHEHKAAHAIQALLMSEFSAYIKLIQEYPDHHKVGLVGSVGYYFKSELDLLASKAGIEIVDCVQSPIERLTLYHQNLSK